MYLFIYLAMYVSLLYVLVYLSSYVCISIMYMFCHNISIYISSYVSIMYVYVLPYIVYDNCQIRYLLDVLSYLSMYVAVYLESSICSAIYIVYDI